MGLEAAITAATGDDTLIVNSKEFNKLQDRVCYKIENIYNEYDEYFIYDVKDAKTPPSGRSQKSHNLIQQMNTSGKKNKKWH